MNPHTSSPESPEITVATGNQSVAQILVFLRQRIKVDAEFKI
ncbi:MAG: hypothetical protein WCK17_19305 [Verrucomicrobiota bacterium]